MIKTIQRQNLQNVKKKIRLIYWPFLLLTISFIVLYTFLNWLLFIKTNAFSIKEDIRFFLGSLRITVDTRVNLA